MTSTQRTITPSASGATETWHIGDVTIRAFVELDTPAPIELFFPTRSAADVLAVADRLGPYASPEGWLHFSVHGFVIDDGAQRILVDGGVGNAKTRPSPWFDHLDTPVLDHLVAAGCAPETIDVVVATHLHEDHVGWFTRAEGDGWVPTFPRARHLVVREEQAHWAGADPADPQRTYLLDSVAPVAAAGLVDLVPADHVVSPSVRLLPTPGHSPGHVSVAIESAGTSAVITGDLLHHPIQVLHPSWDGPFDEDPTAGAATRVAFLERVADTDTIVFGTHVSTPRAGRIVSVADGFEWVPA
jgi:glyoxylase-like metal-dependent hydrolase (beta-lactamase superfamily II)